MKQIDDQWLAAVAVAIGHPADVVSGLIDSWLLLGKTPKEMEARLIILAKANGKTLIFSNQDNPN